MSSSSNDPNVYNNLSDIFGSVFGSPSTDLQTQKSTGGGGGGIAIRDSSTLSSKTASPYPSPKSTLSQKHTPRSPVIAWEDDMDGKSMAFTYGSTRLKNNSNSDGIASQGSVFAVMAEEKIMVVKAAKAGAERGRLLRLADEEKDEIAEMEDTRILNETRQKDVDEAFIITKRAVGEEYEEDEEEKDEQIDLFIVPSQSSSMDSTRSTRSSVSSVRTRERATLGPTVSKLDEWVMKTNELLSSHDSSREEFKDRHG